MLFDSHCHLDFPVFDSDRDQLLEQCHRAGIKHICLPATEQCHWPRLQSILGRHNSGVHIWGALGLHPYFLRSHKDEYLEELDQILSQKPENIVAVGEAGLDLLIENPDIERQEELLAAQALIAAHHGLPLILHVRKAHDQTVSLLRKLRFREGGIVHAWSGSDQQAQAFINLGFKLGIGGSLTYERAKRLRRQVTELPIEAFVLETDAPDIPPAGLARGQRNTPLTLVSVLSIMSGLRQFPEKALACQLLNNTRKALKIPS
ncbi:TatD family hydrolase [Parendozoicomonas sp. Alg238-R29]|uniref:TatD family hydrolase n=1 Tax=Parendozoicomonas sp. Alg238-R29 TaxID=2993446 RepID=UPI00248EA8CF|nr:TatD family hydrolase [Parendozoicomonas sp. Alg238-R29]